VYVYSLNKASQRVPTKNLLVQITGAVPGEGKKYEVDGRLVKRGKSIAFCEGDVKCDGVLIAKGSLTKMITSPKGGEKKGTENSKL
jgi:acyl-coenzyme A thioesterase PaaI-like protein